MNVFDVDDNNHITGLITKIRNLYREFLSLDVAERGAGTSFLDFIKYSIRSKASTDGLTLSMRAATFAAKALNLALSMAVGALIGMAINGVISAIADYAQRIDTAATKTKEAADAANNTTSSLKDLVDAYEELGDKSGWSTEDFDQAKDIQEELLALAKEQGTLDENKANQLDLQNGKYEEQLGLLKDITEEQLKASESKLIQSKDAQGNKLIKTAKDNNRSHFFSSVSANTNRGIMNELKDAGIDVFNKNGSFGAKDLNDPDSIAKYYSELGRALDYIVQNTTEAQRAAGGAYNTVYKYLIDEQSALRDDVDSYNDSTDAVNENVNARRKLQAIDFWSDGKSNGMDVSYSFDKVNSAIETLKNTIDDFDASKLNDLLWGTNEGLTDEQAQALAALRKALTDMDFSADTDGVNAFIQALVQVGIVAQSSAGQVDELAAGAQKMEDISSKMDEIQSAYKASTSAMEEYNQYGYMSLDSLQSLLTMNTEYLNCLELVNGKLQINKQSYAELLAAEYAEAAATILSNAQHEVANLTADDTAESTDDLKEKTEAEKTALENLLPALKNATAATATYSAAQEFANEVEKAGERGVDPAKLEEITNRTNTQLSLLYTNMNAALRGGQKLTNQLNGFGSSSKNAGKSSSATSKSVADLSSAFDTLTKAMKEYNQYGYISADTMKSLIGVDDSALFHYLFTERHTMVDNRAKNVFPHTTDLVHWDFCFDYDNDTAMGNDNEGGLTLSYGYEDMDTIGTKSVFNAHDSKLWCKIRDLFADDLAKMFLNRESALAWSANRILKKFEDYQDVKPEKLWIMDMRRKYFRTYEDNGTTSYLPMMHGNKRHQRRQFQRYQEKYMASKYTGAACTSDDMTIRGYTPTDWTGVQPDGTFHIVPYADTYVSVRYGSNPVKVRGKRGQTYEIQCPIAAMNDTEVYVYSHRWYRSNSYCTVCSLPPLLSEAWRHWLL